MESERSERLTEKLVIGAVVGALVGLALGYVWAVSEERGRLLPARGGPRQPVKPGEVMKLGVSLLTVIRQFSDLINKT